MRVGQKVSIKQIAESIPCSPSTVSIVLNGSGDRYRIALETQKLIINAAREMGYVPKASRQYTHKGAEKKEKISIGLFMGLVDSAPFADMLKGLSTFTSFGEKAVEFCIYPYEPGALCRMRSLLIDNSFDGLIILPTGKDDCKFLQQLALNKPCVVNSQNIPGWNCVIADRIECGAAVARLFIAKGFKKIGLVTRNTLSESGMHRTFGFTSTYEKLGPRDAQITIVEDATDGDNGFASMNELLEKTGETGLDAVFVTEPNNFSGTVNSLRKNNKTSPDDFALVVFGNYSDNTVNQCISPSITTIGIPVKNMMIDSIELLCHQVEGGILNDVKKVHYPEICFRETCTKPENWDSIV